jgi:hypothetical protein
MLVRVSRYCVAYKYSFSPSNLESISPSHPPSHIYNLLSIYIAAFPASLTLPHLALISNQSRSSDE